MNMKMQALIGLHYMLKIKNKEIIKFIKNKDIIANIFDYKHMIQLCVVIFVLNLLIICLMIKL